MKRTRIIFSVILLCAVLTCTSCKMSEFTTQECYRIKTEVESYLYNKYPFEKFSVIVNSNKHKARGYHNGILDLATYYYLTIDCCDSSNVKFKVNVDDDNKIVDDTYMDAKYSKDLSKLLTFKLENLGDESACFDTLSVTQPALGHYFGNASFENIYECFDYAKRRIPVHITYNGVLTGNEDILYTDVCNIIKYYKDSLDFDTIYLFVNQDKTHAVFTSTDSESEIKSEITRLCTELQLVDDITFPTEITEEEEIFIFDSEVVGNIERRS